MLTYTKLESLFCGSYALEGAPGLHLRTLACPEDVPGKGLRVSIWVGVHPLLKECVCFLVGARH